MGEREAAQKKLDRTLGRGRRGFVWDARTGEPLAEALDRALVACASAHGQQRDAP